jgi:hypothetical protein
MNLSMNRVACRQLDTKVRAYLFKRSSWSLKTNVEWIVSNLDIVGSHTTRQLILFRERDTHSRTTGRVPAGSTPPPAVYRFNFPTLIPIPPTPKSPRPRIRDPSVTTMICGLIPVCRAYAPRISCRLSWLSAILERWGGGTRLIID